jgi:signal transduction histidine kinase
MLEQLQTGKLWEGETHTWRPDGSEYDAALTVTPVALEEGGRAHIVAVFRDITAQKEVDRMREKFVANVSHELRTPITNLKLFHALLRSGAPERREEYLDTIEQELQRLERLVEGLLNISQIDRGGLELHLEPVDLNGLVQDVMRSHLLRAEGRGLSVELDLRPDLPAVMADRERMTQVAVNLLINAINFTSEGDRIGIRTGLSSEQGAVVATLTVWDTGIGIDPQDLPFVFNRFFRAETAKVEGVPGTGLGLSIVKEIVEMHRGTVRVESTAGAGSAFTVCLPVEELAR